LHGRIKISLAICSNGSFWKLQEVVSSN
jgi:hypothetical protein